MKFFILFLAVTVSIEAHSDLDDKWEAFKVEFSKVYRLSNEEVVRKEIFAKHLIEIDEHNQRYATGLETYKKGINQFSDLTYEEFAKIYLGEGKRLSKAISDTDGFIEKPLRRQLAPGSFSWRDVDVPVKNQGACGSCWAFASVASVEYRYKRFFNKTYTLSEQELVDCDHNSSGCSGGWSDGALEYVRDKGLNYEKDYPYKAKDEPCHVSNQPKAPVTVKDVCKTPKDEVSYKNHFYQYGPLAVYYFVDSNFQMYQNGIFQSKKCNMPNDDVNHAVLVVGYGSENGKKYWLVRNSWGKKFGEEGYFRILRDAKMCNLGAHPAMYPDVV